MKTPLIVLSLLIILANVGYAEAPQRGSYVQANSAAKQSRRVEQGATHVERSQTRTRDDGATATRTSIIDRDPATRTSTRHTTGQRFDGSTYSSTDVKQRTENGYTRNSSRTNANGETTSRDVVATVDKEAGAVYKEITMTDKEGETHTRAVEKSRQVMTSTTTSSGSNE